MYDVDSTGIRTLNGTIGSSVLRDEVIRRHELEVAALHKFWFRPRVRILIVTDGSAAFDSVSQFGLGRVITELRNDPWWWVRFDVTTAHRGNGLGADHNGFNFASPPAGVALDQFDQIWLFGVQSGGTLQAAEIAAITAFMNGGGGVFATGDHADLGAAMCGDLPRVNKMRRWRTGGPAGTPPPQGGLNRHDTTREGPSAGYQFDDQSDGTPQRITPTRYYLPFGFSVLHRRWYPHPVLCGRNGIIDVLPDHMHEGECVVPSAAAVAANPAEWPAGVAPEVIARATVIPHTNTDGFGAVSGKTFGVLSAYDGHRADVGRIVCDATWHHWFNINLVGFDTTSTQYDKIRNYFWNVALWLAPEAKQRQLFNAAVYGLVWLQPFNEVLLDPTIPIHVLGAAGIDAIGRRASQCTANEWLILELPPRIREVFIRKPIPELDRAPVYEGFESMREHVLGGIFATLREAFDPLSPPAQAPDERELAELVDRGAHRGLVEAVRFERRGVERATKLLTLVEDQVQVRA